MKRNKTIDITFGVTAGLIHLILTALPPQFERVVNIKHAKDVAKIPYKNTKLVHYN